MIFGLLSPTGNVGALSPNPVIVRPIAAVNVAVGDLVAFDIGSSNATYTTAADITNFNSEKCGFNVVIAATAAQEGGIFGVVTTAASAGQRCEVCIAGLVTAKVTGTATAGTTVLINGAGVLVPAAASGTGTGLGISTAANSGGPNLRAVIFNGLTFGSQAA